MVVCVLCAAGPNGRGVFYVRLGPLVCVFIFGRVSCGCLGAVAWRVLRAGSVGLLLRRRILVEVRTLLCGAYSGGGWVAPLFMRVVFWASGGGAFSVYGPGACGR